jgi:hypothetical protein
MSKLEYLDGQLVLGEGSIVYVTETNAIDYTDGLMKKWGGPFIRGVTPSMAQEWVDRNLGGYLEIVGELKGSVPNETNGMEGLKLYNRHQDN